MIYSDFQGMKLSLLGFGTMRLPLLPDKPGALVDEEQVSRMTRYAVEHGVNYFDTAYPYHGGQSELVIGRCLKEYPRDSFYLATKYPGHQIADHYDPAEIFEEQLQKCGVDYFDFYLLHNVYEQSMKTYADPKWGIIDYFIEQKRRGRIRHLGFSCHAQIGALREFLDQYGDQMEFCQIQLNYLDWTLQNAKAKYELLTERGLPVWVMEPVRGGKLARLGEEDTARLSSVRPGESASDWAFRWLQGLPNVRMILSGMSSMDQMVENVAAFKERKPLTAEETALLSDIAEGLKNGVPCTGCRYCCDGCPMGLDIPKLLGLYNEQRYAQVFITTMLIESMPEDKRPAACIGCGKCAKSCPQGIDVPGALRDFAQALSKMPSWAQMCREREEAARRLKAGK